MGSFVMTASCTNSLENFYCDIFCDVVTESRFAQPTPNYSEKTYQPMWYKKPFVLAAPPHTLAVIKREGFKTFSDFWDESYDNMPGLGDRIRHITLELKRLSALSQEELVDMRIKMEPIVKHNQDLFNKEWEERCSQHPDRQLYRIIENIWNSF